MIPASQGLLLEQHGDLGLPPRQNDARSQSDTAFPRGVSRTDSLAVITAAPVCCCSDSSCSSTSPGNSEKTIYRGRQSLPASVLELLSSEPCTACEYYSPFQSSGHFPGQSRALLSLQSPIAASTRGAGPRGAAQVPGTMARRRSELPGQHPALKESAGEKQPGGQRGREPREHKAVWFATWLPLICFP